MSLSDKNQRLRDPFYTSPLPRTYYYPSPTRDVGIDVAIHGPEKKDLLLRSSQTEDPFELGSTFQLSALPQLKNINVIHQSRLSQGSEDLDDTHSKQEQNSTLLDTTHLTTSIDEKERSSASVEYAFSNHRGEGNGEPGSISTIQKYIERFRYSAPKSREDRDKEKIQKQSTFWWMSSDVPPSQELSKQPLIKGASNRPSFTEHLSRLSKPESAKKLTQEAVLELDRETSDLQEKADKLLSKSQLSLASSGPCVSTDGLGSSTALSECSYVTDPQPPYRPIFVNLQGNTGEFRRDIVKSKEKFQTIEEEHPLSPQDALARWRFRRKMGGNQQGNTKISTAQRPLRNTSEIDVKLEEFRKRLFSQRALITSEDIQFERQKMKMLIDDDKDEEESNQHKPSQIPQSNEVQQPILIPQKDPILSRLQEITKTNKSPYVGTSRETDTGFLQQIQQNQAGDFTSLSEREMGFNSNNVNTTVNKDRITISCNDHSTLNRNNTASSHRQYEEPENAHHCIDEMKSMQICGAKQRSFSLNSHISSGGDDQVSIDHEAVFDRNIKDSSENSRGDATDADKEYFDSKSHFDKQNLHGHSENVLNQNTHYHQRLEAEKPCDETNEPRERHQTSRSNKSDSDNSVSSRNSVRSDKHLPSNRKKRKIPYDIDNVSYSKDEEMSDESSKKSDRSSVTMVKSKGGPSENTTVPPVSENLRDEDAESENANKKRINELPTQHSASHRKDVPVPRRMENIKIDVSQSPKHTSIHRVIGETVVDHLFDGPSMISSVDSWASLFPQSPSHSHSLYNSTVVTPTKEASLNYQSRSRTPSPSQRLPATPPIMNNKQMITSTPHSDKLTSSPCQEAQDVTEHDDDDADTDDDFKDDPLMSLLLQQKREYLHKLEVIELRLQQLEEHSS